MSDTYLDAFVPDFSVNADDVCSHGGGHEFVEEYSNDFVQVLTCCRCGVSSVGFTKQ